MVDRPAGFLTLKGLRLGVTGEAGEIYLCSDDLSFFRGNLSVSGNFTANTITTTGGGVSDLCFAIGIPQGDTTFRPLSLSNTNYTTNIGLNLTPNVLGCDAFQLLDKYWDTYYYDTPPAPILVSTVETTSIVITWQNTPTIQSAILNTAVPHIIELRIDYILTSNNPGGSWTNAFTTINTGSKLTSSIELFTSGTGSNLSGTRWNQYIITSGVSYDFRIYGVNYATGSRITKYLNVSGLSTTSIGPPSVVLSPSASSITTTTAIESWSKPVDHDTTTIGNNSSPVISTYRITSIPASTVRYPGLFNTIPIINNTPTTSSPINSNTSITLSNLLPGTSYNTYVSAKNEININYGPTSTNVIQTIIPSAPPILPVANANSILNINSLISPYSTNGGYSLDGTVSVSPIINLNNTSAGIRTISTTSILLNNIPGSTDTNIASLTGYAGLSSDYNIPSNTSTTQINGYPLLATPITNTNGKGSLIISAETDYYSGSSSGFWKTGNVYVQAVGIGSNYIPSVNSYSFGLQYSSAQGAGTVQTTPVVFYIDNLNVVPTISNAGISSEVNNGYQWVSGIPSYNTSATFKTQFNMNNIANKFIRYDRIHANIQMVGTTTFSEIVSIKQTDIGLAHKYYNSTGDTSTSSILHNIDGLILQETPGDIQFNDFNINLGSTGDNKYTEDLTLLVRGFNLYGGTITGVTGGTLNNKPLRIDTRSINILDNMIGITQVRSGAGTYPSLGVSFNNAGDTYYHTDSILGITYAQELQLVNGFYQSPIVGSGYRNYTNYYFPDNPVLYDYSVIIPDTTYRYTTFKMRGIDIGIPANGSREKIRVIINNMNGLLVNLNTPGLENHSLDIRVVDIGNGESLVTDTTTRGWMNACEPISPVGVLYGDNGTYCLNQQTSSNTTRDIYIRNGTTSNAIVYIRIGIPGNLNAYFSGITVQALESFV